MDKIQTSDTINHDRRRFFGDGSHLRRTAGAHVEDGTYVQRAHRGVRVPRASRAMLAEHLGERIGVFGQVLQWHGAVLLVLKLAHYCPVRERASTLLEFRPWPDC